jgi:hypothetical protein
MAAAGWITWILANQLVEVASQLPTYRQNIHVKIEALRHRGKGPLGRAADSAQDIGQELAILPAAQRGANQAGSMGFARSGAAGSTTAN